MLQNTQPILGLDSCELLGLVNSINNINTNLLYKELISYYNDCLEGIGELGRPFRIETD